VVMDSFEVVMVLSEARVSLLTERRRLRPYGINGGEAGKRGRNFLYHKNGISKSLPGKCSVSLSPGDLLEIHTPGGGGWGMKS